ncbi:MAG: CBS domain-containing protein [Acidimicrobiales bacterium]|nr:CBS domain-containing protein [Acidimicrobiia bacterium]NNC80318.1 CBS domain-containing protein [Acidimicrobiales bacterium]RZV48783.1 MAG: CBS domain-containing protein [Acidimicrobiales bacterium]
MATPTPITDIMTADPRTIERSQNLSEAYHTLKHAAFHHLIVLDGDDVVGMLATTDILRLAYDADGLAEQSLATYLDHQFNIADAMTETVRTLGVEATAKDAAEILAEGGFHSIVIIDADGGLAGIVTTTDLARFVVDKL